MARVFLAITTLILTHLYISRQGIDLDLTEHSGHSTTRVKTDADMLYR